jgi:hypothetical protein
MAKKKKDDEKDEPLPTHLEQGEAPDTDARLHGDDSLPAEAPPVNGTEPDEAQQPLPGTGTVKVRISTQNIDAAHMQRFVESLRAQGLDAEVVEETEADSAPAPVDGHAQAVSQARSYHEGVEAALRKYAHNTDGTEFIGMRGITLAEALETNNQQLRAKLQALTGKVDL